MWRDIIQGATTTEDFALYTFAPPATPSALAEVEASLQVTLPEELRSLLRETDGISHRFGWVVWPTDQIRGTNLALRSDEDYRQTYMPFDCLLFFADAGNGDLFGFPILAGAVRGDKIYAWNHEDDSRVWVAPSLRTFLEWWLTGKISV